MSYSDGTSIKMTYTLWGELSEKTFQDGTKVAYFYDPQGRETKQEWTDSQGRLLKEASKKYNAFHLISEKDAKGISPHYGYDSAGRLASERRKERQTLYGYDSLGLGCRSIPYQHQSYVVKFCL